MLVNSTDICRATGRQSRVQLLTAHYTVLLHIQYTTVIPNYCESSFLTKATLTVGVTDKIMIVEAHQDHTESINASFFLSALSPPDCRNVQTPAWCFSVYLVNRAFAKL